MFCCKPLPLYQILHNSLIFLLFNIFSTSYFSISSTSTGFTSSSYCSPTCSLYCTTQLTFTTKWILIEVGNHNLIILVETTSLMIYGLTYQSTNFFTSHSLNTKSFILNIILSPTFHTSASFLLLFTYLFISSCTLFNAASASF